MSDELSDKELLWRQYHLLSDLYTFYLNLILNANLLFYGVTGAIVTYILANAHTLIIRWSLALSLLFPVKSTNFPAAKKRPDRVFEPCRDTTQPHSLCPEGV